MSTWQASTSSRVVNAIVEELATDGEQKANVDRPAKGNADQVVGGAVRELVEAGVQLAAIRGKQLRAAAAAAAAMVVRAARSRRRRGRVGAGPRSRGSRGNPPTSDPSISEHPAGHAPSDPSSLPIDAIINPARVLHTRGVVCNAVGERTEANGGAGATCKIVSAYAGVGTGEGAAAGGATLVAGFDSPATASTVRSVLAMPPTAPSHTTIAPPAEWPPAILAMCAIARRGGSNNERTQHRPKPTAWTGAPWHTRTATPPGESTSTHWKTVPVGRAIEHEDENGDAHTTTYVIRATSVSVRVRVPGVGAAVVNVRERRGGEVSALDTKVRSPSVRSPSPAPPAAPASILAPLSSSRHQKLDPPIDTAHQSNVAGGHVSSNLAVSRHIDT